MKQLAVAVFVSFALVAVSSCGGGNEGGLCADVVCPAGTGCDPSDGTCRPFAVGGGGSDAGVDAGGTCVTEGCPSQSPVCDPIAQVCRVCTPTQGCGGETPICDTGANPRACVECLENADCAFGQTCTLFSHRCVGGPVDGGDDAGMTGDAGEEDGGGDLDGGDPDAGVGDGGWNGPGSCAPHDAGVVPCSTECDRGYSCLNGQCVLNGGGGAVQVTLRWNTTEDLDLHVDEPLSGGGVCEIYYGDPNDLNSGPSSCGAMGSLDLDSEPACPSPPDYVEVENVIYPNGVPAPSGTYEVRVDHYMNCDSSLSMVPFEVEVRNNGVTTGLCGMFTPNDPDWDDSGSAGGGRVVMTFVVP